MQSPCIEYGGCSPQKQFLCFWVAQQWVSNNMGSYTRQQNSWSTQLSYIQVKLPHWLKKTDAAVILLSNAYLKFMYNLVAPHCKTAISLTITTYNLSADTEKNNKKFVKSCCLLLVSVLTAVQLEFLRLPSIKRLLSWYKLETFEKVTI